MLFRLQKKKKNKPNVPATACVTLFCVWCQQVSNPSFLSVDDKEADYTYNDVSEEKKRTADDMGHGQRFAFGLGKRGVETMEWDDDDGGVALAAPIWHPAVRRARLQYGFGLGKRDDYDAATASEYDEVQTDDAADIN